MLGSNTKQNRRIEVLEKRYERLSQEYDTLKNEKIALENELSICRAKLGCVEKAKDEFMNEIETTKRIREQYERAYEQLKVIKKQYSAEVKKLIEQMKY